MRRSEALKVVGGIGTPSKMPGKSYGLPAGEYCHTGAKLAQIEGSTCRSCYACKGNYLFDNVRKVQEIRLKSVISNPKWVKAMILAVQDERWFRWHDSGDLQSVDHLARICAVARATPHTNHWLPTREYKIVKDFLDKGGIIPNNLTIRLSAHMVDQKAPDMGLPTSTVHNKELPIGQECPAPSQGNNCDTCRSCWDSSVPNISYHKH